MLRLIVEPHRGNVRRLQIIGVAEAREEDETARLRAEGIREWFLGNDIPGELLDIECETGGLRGSRRVDLKLLGAVGDNDRVRNKAEGVLSRIGDLLAGKPGGRGPQENAGLEKAHAKQPPAKPTPVDAAPKVVSAEEVVTPGGRRGLRITFTALGLDPESFALEVSEREVRLASTLGSWPQVAVPLPFAVEPPAEPAARFSRRVGILTVNLLAVA